MIGQTGKETKFPRIKFGLSREQEKFLMDMAEKMTAGLKQIRSEYESDWRELGSYFAPHMVRIDDTTKTKKSKWHKIINNTCRTAARTLASGMQSGLTSPARPWFKLGIEDWQLAENARVREWLDDSTARMQTVFRRSNFYNTSHTLYGALGIFGTAGQMQTQDFEDVILFRALMTGRYWIGTNHKGRVDRVVIMSRMTVYQMVQAFGYENCDPQTKGSYDKSDYFIERDVWIAIFPNPFAKPKSANLIQASNEKPFVSCYWVTGHNHPLKTAGYDRFPCQVPRWETTDDEPWGVGVGMDAIGDTKAVQLKEREKAKGLQKLINPPTSAPSEMRQGQYPVSGLPGGVTYRPPNVNADAIRPLYEVNLPLQYLIQDIQVDEQRINRAFYADLFLMLANSDRRQMTATEVAERHEEKLIQLGPVVERLGNEYLDPCIERAFEIMMLHEQLAPPPEEIQGMPLKVEYISVLAQAQQQVGIGAIEKFLSFTGYAAQFFPNAIDKVDIDQSIDEVGTMLGVPQRIIVGDDAVAEKREARAQQAQQAQQMQMGMAGVQAAQALSETPIGDTTALNAMIGV
ncbi:MAG: portal protein [Alphaproteobacteria bacterium]|jgi:hypothetical protein|nr:portal protein [Alphaproteobacteria bacterium]